MEGLTIHKTPKLNSPYLVAGFSGWANAAEVSTGVVSYLKRKLGAKKIAEIEPRAFYDFASLRPAVAIESGVVKALEYPSNEFFYSRMERAPHDLTLFIGAEPHLRWEEYGRLILEVAQRLGVVRVCAIGSLYEATPHTAEPRVSGFATSPELASELTRYGIELATYQGPTSFHVPLLAMCRERNIEGVSIWGRAPHYVPVHNPKVIAAVVCRLLSMLELDIDVDDLRDAASYLEQQVNSAISQNPKLAEYVRTLEESYRMAGEQSIPLAEGAEHIIREVEEFLKRQQLGPDNGS